MTAIAVDTETTGLNPWKGNRAFAVSLCNEKGEWHYFQWEVKPNGTPTPQVTPKQRDIDQIQKLLDKHSEIVMHNAPFDTRMLECAGVKIKHRLDAGDITDTALMSHVFNSGELHGLKPLSIKYLRELDSDEKDLRQSVIEARRHVETATEIEECYWMGDPALVQKYAVMDSIRTIRLRAFYQARFDEEPWRWDHFRRHQQLQPIIYSMGTNGILVLDHAENEVKRYRDIADKKLAEIRRIAKMLGVKDYNPNSPKQTGTILYDKMGFQPEFTEAGNYSTTYEILLMLRDEANKRQKEFIDGLVSYRQYEVAYKYGSEYLRSMDDDRILHFNFNQGGTCFTRFSSSGPNGQNIGKPDPEDPEAPNLRGMFGPRRGYYLLSVDYAQLEGRICAYLSGDPLLNKIYSEGRDWHTETTLAVFGDILAKAGVNLKDPNVKDNPIFKSYRKLAKNMNFAKQYGGGADAVARYCEGNFIQAQEYSRRYDAAYHGVTNYRKGLTKECNGRVGKWLHIAQLEGDGLAYPVYPKNPKDAASGKIQGTAGEIIKRAMIRLWYDVGMNLNQESSRMLLQIHDELLFEIKKRPEKSLKKDVAVIANVMQDAGKPFYTPTGAGLFPENWGEEKTIKL